MAPLPGGSTRDRVIPHYGQGFAALLIARLDRVPVGTAGPYSGWLSHNPRWHRDRCGGWYRSIHRHRWSGR
ncbi:MAG: hypothetical protein WCF90_08060 [Methanomicrobiales archaeon]